MSAKPLSPLRILPLVLLWAFWACTSVLIAQPFVYETAYELSATGDFDGDALEDLLVVDRETGYYRIGYGDASSDVIWSEVRASGVELVQGVSVGRLVDMGFDSFAITAPETNKVHVISANNRSVTSMPIPVQINGLGTQMVVARHFAGSPFDDLIVGTIWNDLPNTSKLHSLEQASGSFTPLGTFNEGPAARGNRIQLETPGSDDKAAMMVRGTGSDTFYVFNLASGFNPASPMISLGGLPLGTDYAYGFFNGTGFAHILFFQPGGTQLRVRPVVASGASSYSLGSEILLAVANPIDTVFTLPNPGGPDRLIILYNDGASASVYDFNGTSAPVNLQTLTPPNPGDRLIGAPALSNGKFLLLNANGDGMRTENAQVFSFNGTNYQSSQAWELQAAAPGVAAATILLFQGEPFVDANAQMKRAMQAGQWSTEIDISGSNVIATTEKFVSSVDGLGSPTSLNLGAKLAGEDHSLPSQYRDDIAIHSFVRAEGVRIPDFVIAPPGGNFDKVVQVDFLPTPPTSPATVFYRINGGAWTAYTGPFYLFEDASIDYYALVSGQQTIVRHADYQFLQTADELDSDADGIPDYAEMGAGLDPNGGLDTDGDGFSDLEELVLGSDPNDDGDTPNGWTPNDGTPRPTIAQEASFQMEVTPRPYDGTVPGPAYAAANARVTAYDLLGNNLGAGAVGHDPNSIAGLQVWLCADSLNLNDGQQVKTWEDSSNFNHPVTQEDLNKRPVFKKNAVNGQPAVRFDGNDLLLTTADFELDDFTLYVVFKDDANIRNSERLVDHNRSTGFWAGRSASGGSQWGAGVLQPTSPYGIFGTFTNGNVHTLTSMRAGTLHTLYRNGTQLATQSVSNATTALAKIAIGGKVEGTTPGEWMNGDIAEVLVYNRALSTPEREKLDEHFRVKYGNDTPKAYLSGLSVNPKQGVMAIATDTHYAIETSHTDTRLGREMIKVVPLPDQSPVTVGYSFSGGSLATEAANWIADAQATYLGASPTTVIENLQHMDTLATLLLERRLASILLSRGDVASKYVTLFPARPLDQGRILLTESQLLDLRNRRPGVDDGFLLSAMLEEINNQLTVSSDPNILQLKSIATEIYDISSRLHNVPPRNYRLPIDVLRDFIQEGTMDDRYRAEAGFTFSQLDQALQGAQSIMTLLGDRPVQTLRLRTTPSTFSGPCVTLETEDAVPVSKSLFDAEGKPYNLLQAGNFTLGNMVVFEVVAFTDSQATPCASEDVLEVISLQIVELPDPPPTPKRNQEKPKPKPANLNNAFTLMTPRSGQETHLQDSSATPEPSSESKYINHVEVLGEEAIASIGEWQKEDTAILAANGRGKVSFNLTTTEADIFRLELEGHGDQDGKQNFNLRIHLDGEYLGRFQLQSTDAKAGFVHVETPWIPPSTYRVDLFWDDTPKSDPLVIEALRLQQKTGPDSNGDGIKDWVASKLYDENDIEVAPMRSQISPVTIEGRGRYLSMMAIEGDIQPQPGPGATWSAQIPLAPFESTDVNVYFQNAVLRETRSITWEPTNVLNAGRMILRKGDALLLTAKQAGVETGQMQLQIGEERFRNDVTQPVVYRFEKPGRFQVVGAAIDRDGRMQKGRMDVVVLDTEIGQAPSVWVGNTRHWDVPAFTEYISLEASEHVLLEDVAYLPKGGRRVDLNLDRAETEYVVARITETGAILGVVPVQGFEVKTALDTYVRLVETFEDGSQLVGIGILASPVPENVSIKLTIFVSGVTFEDGSISKTLTAKDFDELGRTEVRFNRAANSKTAVCHITEAYQGFVSIGTVEQLREKRP